jgi:hypothetical protein
MRKGSLCVDVVVEQLSLLHEAQDSRHCLLRVQANTELQVFDELVVVLMGFQQSGPPEAVQPAGQHLHEFDHLLVLATHYSCSKLLYRAVG